MTRVGWLDCSAGVSGDMLVGALSGLTPAVEEAARAVIRAVAGASYRLETVQRGGLRATAFVTEDGGSQPLRTLPAVLGLLERLELPQPVLVHAHRVFERLADAESRVHGVAREQVHFHEVGAVDTVLDVVCCCAGVHALRLDRLVVSPVALGGGTATTGHGPVPVPGPAVLELLRASVVAGYGGGDVELATPTGVALVAELADDCAPMPGMSVEQVGVGAGTRESEDRPNVVRLVVGTAREETSAERAWELLEANVDDLDPRLWPGVLDRLLAAGAADAWLTPIVMKKGRPAHTVSALVPARAAAAVREAMFRETSTIGVRSAPVAKTELDREWVDVDVGGQPVRVKIARLRGEVVNASPEWGEVAAAAEALGLPAKQVLADAIAQAQRLLS